MTTNAGSRELAARQIGFGGSDISSDDDKSIRRVFSPEFIGRLDARIAFEPLPKAIMSKIVDKKIEELNLLLKPKKVKVKLKTAARKRLSELGYDPRYGARPLAKKVDIYRHKDS